MNQKVLAAMVAVTALSVIRHNEDRHVPGTKTETFETDPGTAERLVDSGAAKYAVDPAEAAPPAATQAPVEQVAAAHEAVDRAAVDQAAPAKTAAKKR